MSSSNARRVGVVAWPLVLGAFVLTACGSDDDGAPSQSTIELNNGSTAFVVKEPATTVPTESVTEEGKSTISQEYVVQSGDYPLVVAEKFGVTLDELVSFNEWSDVESDWPYPGETIKIPPGATASPAPDKKNDNSGSDAAETADTEAETEEAEEPGDTIPEAGDNCDQGTYTITADDTTRISVAEKFDVTVEALDAANSDNPGYAAFYPGLEIVIPAKSDC